MSPFNKGKKCKSYKLVKVKGRRKKQWRCATYKGKVTAIARRLRRKKKCPNGVNKRTGKCLKRPRRR